MATFAWDLDAAGAAAGDEVTVTAGNAGTDGPTSVNSVTGGTRVYDNAQAPPGLTWSVRLATGATSGTSNMVWGATRIPNTTVGYFRIPLRFSEMLSNRSLARVRNGTTQILRVHRTADGRLELRNSGNSSVASGSVPMPEDTWVELGIFADPGNTSTCRIRWWLWGAAAVDFEDEVVATDNFSATATVNELTVGNIAAGSSIPDYWVGPVRYSDTDWIGPLSTVHDAAGALDGVGSLTGAASRTRSGIIVIGGTGALTADGETTRVGTAGLAGTAALTSAATAARAATAALAGTADLDATATVDHAAAAPLAGTTGLDATAAVASPIGSLADNFDDGSVDTSLWPGNYGDVAEVGGRLRIDCDVSQWSGAKSAERYFLTGSAVHVQAWPPAAGGATVAYLSVLVTTTTPGTDAGFNIDAASNGIAFLSREGFSDPDAVFATYSPTDHAWLRLSEAGGTLTWETSPDGIDWTVRRTAATPSWAGDGDLALLAESHRDAGTDDFAELDNLNVTPGAVHDATAGLASTAALSATGSAARAASGPLDGVTALSGAAAAGRVGSADLAPVGALTASAGVDRPGTAALTGTGSLAAAAGIAKPGVVAVAGVGALAAAAVPHRTTSTSLAAVGALAATAAVVAGGPITPPDTGLVARPNTGTTARPATGATTRPDTGTITRPDTGLILQP